LKPKEDVEQRDTVRRSKPCLKEIESWIHPSILKLNGNKAESCYSPLCITPKNNDTILFNVRHSSTLSISHVQNLSVIVYSTIPVDEQEITLCKSDYGQLWKISYITRLLFLEVQHTGE